MNLPINPPDYYMDEPPARIEEYHIFIENEDGKVTGQAGIEVRLEDNMNLSAWYNNREIIHVKEWFRDAILDASVNLIDQPQFNFKNIQHNFEV